MDYFKSKRQKKPAAPSLTKSSEPLLTDEDEAFLRKITAQIEGDPPALPDRPLPQDLPVAGESSSANNAQVAIFNGAQDVPLPDVPDTPNEPATAIESEQPTGKGKGKEKEKKSRWSFIQRSKSSKRNATAADLKDAANGLKSPQEGEAVSPDEAKKEQDEIESVLGQLNLAAVNNRVFSVSAESKELLRKFTLVLKDLINGVPTAYSDLESLLHNSEGQLQKTYKVMPSFMQSLVEKLPEKFTASLGPEFLAAAAEKQGLKSGYLTKAAGLGEKAGLKVRVPNLKDLVTKPGAVAGLLRTIMQFLRARFPAVLGMNVLWSLALFVLLLIFWYCHKRGREVRLEKERKLTEAEMAALKSRIEAEPAGLWNPSMETTMAPEGASLDEVHEGALMIEAAKKEDMEGEGETGYAEGGSLARAMKAEEAEEAAGTKEGAKKAMMAVVAERELNDDDSIAGPSADGVERARLQGRKKEISRQRRLREAPSMAPLDSQESCVVC